ncbi:MAG TPA: hydrolase 1, exosortase A system-associated [Steroidobacteraceae bacterium]|nr:hydrolase 1, exosortase A system-associated [Steroidobacteraceae bacterium]HRX89837.1 hydrolase 1, exosortase A system-associated [Steroidobacteraceae bacterium]
MSFECAGDTLVGVLSSPQRQSTRFGVCLIVGGPQYRVGSHRQFQQLARTLAARGIPLLRFDYRGQGDSGGAYRGFEHVDLDVRAAIDCLMSHCPQVQSVILWGLCDGASAALLYAARDERVGGLVLINPWITGAATQAQTMLKHYYGKRILEREFWRKLFGGQIEIGKVAAEYLSFWRRARQVADVQSQPADEYTRTETPFQRRMLLGVERCRVPMLLITSGNDLTAAEFLDVSTKDPAWSAALQAAQLARRHLADADHTFSCKAWHTQLEDWTVEWILSQANARC